MLADYASSNSKVFSDLLSNCELEHFDEENLNLEVKESDLLDFVFERCRPLFELNHSWYNEHYDGGEYDYMRLVLVKHESQYISIIDSTISDEKETNVKIHNRLPVQYCFESCKSLFELVDLFLSNAMDLEEDDPQLEKIGLEVILEFDLLSYLKSNGFDVSHYSEIQQRLNAFNER